MPNCGGWSLLAQLVRAARNRRSVVQVHQRIQKNLNKTKKMKARKLIGGSMFVMGLLAATSIEESVTITIVSVGLIIIGGLMAKAFDFQNNE